ncbi:hypothetical protein HaLaN_02834, partial [Haematococcus lacustris]
MQMSVITSKLSELDADRKELAEYQAADRDRRALEFALLERDLSSNRKKLEEARLQELQSRKAVLEADIGDLEEKVARQTDTAESTAEEVEALQQAITKTEGELEE